MSAAYNLLIGPFEVFGFMRTALVACLALALASGPLGTLLLLRRMSQDGDVLSHAVMPGAALGFLYAGYSVAALSAGGLITGALVASAAGLVARLRPSRKEASLAAFYLVSLALGVIVVSVRGSNADLMHVLFGTVLAVDMRTLTFIAAVSSATLLVVAAIYRPLAVDSFDPGFLEAVGGRGGVYRAIFVTLLVLNLVASFQAFGTLLAIGPMLLPAAAALCWTQRIWSAITLTVAFGFFADYVGLLVSYNANLPSGPAIVLLGGIIYGLSVIAAEQLSFAGKMSIKSKENDA
jgi:zinc/manganese transport system permease protein